MMLMIIASSDGFALHQTIVRKTFSQLQKGKICHSLAMTGISTFSAVITGNCRYHSDWSNAAEGDGNQQCNKEEAMVGIKKTYFDSAGDDDWKYKIRCCKVCSYFCTFLVSRGHQKSKSILIKIGKILIIFCFNYCSWIPTH